MFPVGPDGRLGASIGTHSGRGSGPNKARQQGPHAHQVVFDPTNRYLLEADLGIDQILVYRFEAASGRLTPNDPPSASLEPGAGPRHLAFHPNGRRVFVTNELASSITSFAWDGAKGTLRSLGTVSTLPQDFTGQNSTAEIAVHPNGRFLYGSNRGHDSIVVLSIPTDGPLVPIDHVLTRGKTPRNFTIDPTGKWLIAANQGSGTLAVFSIDQKTGALSATGPLAEVGSPVCVLFWP
jgi:6-phosphogluconolactonase